MDREKRTGTGIWKWKREVTNGESERGCEENDRGEWAAKIDRD